MLSLLSCVFAFIATLHSPAGFPSLRVCVPRFTPCFRASSILGDFGISGFLLHFVTLFLPSRPVVLKLGPGAPCVCWFLFQPQLQSLNFNKQFILLNYVLYVSHIMSDIAMHATKKKIPSLYCSYCATLQTTA